MDSQIFFDLNKWKNTLQMIRKVRFKAKVYDLVIDDDVYEQENVYTIIVGKNGTGKSSMLRAIASGFDIQRISSIYNMITDGFEKTDYEDIVATEHPNNIIAVSTSPFDKFPVPRRYENINGYTYLGIRDISNTNIGLGYMSKIIASLLQSKISIPEHWRQISSVLEYLGFHGFIDIHFHYNSINQLSRYLEEANGDFHSFGDNFATRNLNRRFFQTTLGDLDKEKVLELQGLIYNIARSWGGYSNRNIFVRINEDGIHVGNHMEVTSLIFLLNSGFVRLKDISLLKRISNEPFSLADSSSGEQSVILSFLGIASRLTDNTLVCIDEPEICLHPEWQERYIQMLIKAFSYYKYCHFIIATHSPQIVSKLDPKNCYIVDIETCVVSSSKKFINQSVDFQLAELFKSPGFKNEYLGRLAFTIFSKVGKYKKFDQSDLDKFRILMTIYDTLDDNDPTKELITVLKDLHARYA